jgi:hypothetical protein
MPHLRHIADTLRAGDIDAAKKSKAELGLIKDEVLKLEIEEIAKQAVLKHLKDGEVDTARKIQKLFSMPKDMFEDTVAQAVLSSFRDGDFETVKELRKELPIPERLSSDIIAYCSTWKNTRLCTVMEEVLR